MIIPGACTVLVDMRVRLARSERPRRIFQVSLDAARRAGVVSAKRVLDSTPLNDAVATQDTVTMIRAAIRRLLKVVDSGLEAELRQCWFVMTTTQPRANQCVIGTTAPPATGLSQSSPLTRTAVWVCSTAESSISTCPRPPSC